MHVNPPSEPSRERNVRRVRPFHQGLSLLLPAVLLAACGPLPVSGTTPETSVEPPLPVVPKVPPSPTASQPPQAPALAPLATPQQVVKAVSVGRRDPFANVLVPTVILQRDNQPKPTTPAKPPVPLVLTWPKGLTFEGVLHSTGDSEAIVSYLPEAAKGSGPRAGSLRVGDTSADKPELLPPGWQVAAIDVERGALELRRGGQTVRQTLPR